MNLGIKGIDVNNPADILRRGQDLITNNGAVPLLDDQLPLTQLAIVPPATTAIEVPGGAQQYDLYYRLAFQSQAYARRTGVLHDAPVRSRQPDAAG